MGFFPLFPGFSGQVTLHSLSGFPFAITASPKERAKLKVNITIRTILINFSIILGVK